MSALPKGDLVVGKKLQILCVRGLREPRCYVIGREGDYIAMPCGRRWLLGLGRLLPGGSSVARPLSSLAGLSKIAKNAPTTKAARGAGLMVLARVK